MVKSSTWNCHFDLRYHWQWWIFCKIIVNFKVIVKKYILDPDDNFWRNSCIIVLTSFLLRFLSLSLSYHMITIYNSWPLHVYCTPHCIYFHFVLTLMLLVANFTNIKWCKKMKNDQNPRKWVLIWEYSKRAFQWVPTWHGLDVFQRFLHFCALGECTLSIVRVKYSSCSICIWSAHMVSLAWKLIQYKYILTH